MKPLVFLDIDGVLNDHSKPDGSPYCTIRPANVKAFNYLLKRCEPNIVLSSAWRYIVHGKQMTLLGFEYMLHSHGVIGICKRIVGVTCPDELCSHCGFKHGGRKKFNVNRDGLLSCLSCDKHSTRGDQIGRYIMGNFKSLAKPAYVVIDDLDLGISAAFHPFVQTHPRKGLTMAKAKEAARILEGN